MENAPPDERKEKRDEAPEEKEQSFIKDDSLHQKPPEDVFAYNEMRSCADLFRMYEKDGLFDNPDFQRDFVWTNSQQTKFIDSLVKGYPIPSMCFAFDRVTRKRTVIDGKQRMRTIARFLTQEEKPWRLTRLDDVDPAISGKTSEDIRKTQPDYFSGVEEHVLPVTVLHCELEKEEHLSFIFNIFHRLNDGGMRLNNQEIRNCIFSGPLNNLLRKLDKNKEWRCLNRMEDGNTYRFVKQELILRFFAFLYQEEEYTRRGMANFLNNFMNMNRNNDGSSLEEKEKIFERVVSLLFSKIFNKKASSKRISANTLYPVMVGIARNIDMLENMPLSELQNRYYKIEKHELFTAREGLSVAEVVHERLHLTQTIFGDSP